MNRSIAVAVALLGLAAFGVGCQNSGHEEHAADANKPVMATDNYTVAYTAKADTPWMHTATDTTSAGTLKAGDTVYLQGVAPSTGMVAAKTTDGRIVYVPASSLTVK